MMAAGAGPPLATPKRRSKDDANPHFTPKPPPAASTWDVVAGAPLQRDWQKHRGTKYSGLHRSSTFDKYVLRFNITINTVAVTFLARVAAIRLRACSLMCFR